ncbi:choline/carnitine/betaine transport [Desulfosporosinus orientis DSM 765]|uniref:Choline/carnitine/betaine transport n=1 Tax=Desulfosporosinus orientis (strain ATCC 19365 / DSM 765 / NCIMB 8382 / VKM B-1628 / Singapore I) TaxID=768706 RepID=G7W7P9_DESOD|nr:BCCT family transporter [Desulfosporosinus orientis]AET66114.1 choline/carnitine/betaine transport [Desulfosporosinus orientis DSM 765]
MSNKKGFLGNIDRHIFFISAMIMVVFVCWTLIQPKEASLTFDSVQTFITKNFGWSYLLGVSFFLLFALFIAASKFGTIILGKDGEKPEYSTLSWFAMLFAAGMGIGLVFWGVAEPMTHYAKPPYGQPSSIESAQIAMRYTFFHWGLHPWSVFAVVGLAMAYFQFRKGLPALVSSTLYPLLGEKGIKGWIGKLVDILSVFATIFGVATSLGLGAMQIGTGLSYAYGIPTNTTTTVVIILIITVLFITSAVTGIERGIKFLSNTNILLLFLILTFMLFVGPSRFILNGFTETIGSYAQNIIQMSFWADAYETNPGWVGGWTIFYWAWWVAWGPFVGAFIARISRGRSVREFILGVVIAPTLMSFIWVGVMGNSSLYVDVIEHGGIAAQVAKDISTAIFVMFQYYPLSGVLTTLTTLIIAVFFITSADSATFVMAMFTSGGELNPTAGLKITWGLIESAAAIALMIAGGLSALQTASITAAFPFMFVMFAMTAALVKAFREELK